MTIVIDTAPVGAISDYPGVLAELRDLQDNAAYSVDAIDRALRKAESYILRRVRVADMEVSETLTVTGATASLPTDCKELRAVIWNGAPDEYPMAQMSLAGLSVAYGGRTGAYPLAYAREGRTLRFGPVADGTARIVYHADLAPLTEDSPSNWLLRKAPDLYVAAAQYYLCRRERDDPGASMALTEVESIIASLIDENNRLAGGNMIPHAITQVCGSRG